MDENMISILLQKIQTDFDERFDKSNVIADLYEKVKKGVATYAEANDFAIEVGNILADAYKNVFTSDILPDGKLQYEIAKQILNPTLGNNYNLISDVTKQVQQSLNKSANIGIKAIKAELNQDRIDGLVNKVSSYDNYDDALWVLDEPVKTFSQSIVDDSIRENAEFHSKAGMRPKIVRKVAGNCCEWCSNFAGSYTYPDGVPQDVYRRHQRCRCTVDYNPGRGKVQNVHSKKWKKRGEQQEIDYMGQVKVYEADLGGKKYAIKTYKNDNYDNIWCQTYSSESQRMCEYLNTVVNNKYPGVKQIVVAKNKTLQGIAAYDHSKKTLFICEELIDEESFSKIVGKGFFAAESLDDILIHELGGHKSHWEAVEAYCQINSYKTISDAKQGLEMLLRKYVTSQMVTNPFYLREYVSENAYRQFVSRNILNECIADATIQIERHRLNDSNLLQLVKEVINYDGKSD